MRKANNRHESYEDYISFQKQKTEDPVRREKWLGKEWDSKIQGFVEIFTSNQDIISHCKKALCIGARTGQEVVALQSMGIDAIGIDIVEQPPNVIQGDMHELPFPDGHFDLVFSNVYDHSLYPTKKAKEIERVLSKDGVTILQFQVGIDQDEYTEFYVTNPYHDVLSLFDQSVCLKNCHIERNCFGMNYEIVLKKNDVLVKLYEEIGSVFDLEIPTDYEKIWTDINLETQIDKAKSYNIPDEKAEKYLSVLKNRGYYLASLAKMNNTKNIIEAGTAEGWQYYTFAHYLRSVGGNILSLDLRDVRNEKYKKEFEKETTFINGTSLEMKKHCIENNISDIGLFYIDASHDKGAVIQDVLNLKDFQSDNPIWVFDDFDTRFGCFYDIDRICQIKQNYKVYSVGKTASGNPTHQVIIFGRM
jgi:hypothetical protein